MLNDAFSFLSLLLSRMHINVKCLHSCSKQWLFNLCVVELLRYFRPYNDMACRYNHSSYIVNVGLLHIIIINFMLFISEHR
jgi:hypothetical protein